MTIIELIKKLSELPLDLEVLMASEKLGSSYFEGPKTISVGYVEEKNYAYAFHQEEYYDVDSETGESEYPGDNAVVLWPG